MRYVYDCDERLDLDLEGRKRLLGGKAANLSIMAVELGLPVPPAFTISTEACRAYLEGGWPEGLDAEIREHMARMEARVGHRFGDPADPLLVSVRSGAPVSMPGMMDTILNLGLNEATTAGLAARSGDPAFAANCRARFEAMYRDIVGVDAVPADPWLQLRGAIEAVFRSWNSERARAYRRREGIPDDLCTAVTVQAMVFGNRGPNSGTGVLFTRNPATGEPVLYGDVMFNAQGEDVVAGTHQTEPIAVLETRLPEVASELSAYARRLERHYRDLCDIEFTIEDGRLWLLQCRVGKRSPQAALRIAVDMASDPDFPLSREEAVRRVSHLLADPPRRTAERRDAGPPLARGLGASPGIAAGEIATTPEAAVAAAEAGRSVILVRPETSPDDVHGMARAAGILTATGGLASHAAVVARGWGIPAVVGCAELSVGDGVVTIAGRTFREGDVITVNGTTGEIFAGAVVGESEIVPEAVTLLAWARELGIDVTAVAAAAPPTTGAPLPSNGTEAGAPALTATSTVEVAPAPGRERAAGPEREDVLRALLIKGFATPDALAEAFGAPRETVASLLDRLVADGLVAIAAGSFRLTDDGKSVAGEGVAVERARLGPEAAVAALDAFVALDRRMKETVTAWQMREVEGQQVLNDHSDPAYDAAVLDRLADLHRDTVAWLRPLADRVPSLRNYVERLERAQAAVEAGDHRYVASPRVDSYHSIWFELHEHLILLAGRSRAEEVAAGRA
ncbi:MAG TPA: pyruvate, phosphate dikinase [Candidatus Binatia bacterium]|nr:pyruvate, phosphate dikinase [Candidatus Binatia bacterium]